MKKRVLFLAFSIMMLALLPLNANASVKNVAYHGPAEISCYLLNKGVNFQYPVNYARYPDIINKTDPGEVASDTLENALRLTNYIRHIAGLDEVILDGSYNYYAQCASYVNSYNNVLDHYPVNPGMSDGLYQVGYEGAGRSNLAQSMDSLNDTIFMYMEDSDPSNINRVGHRRWVLYPDLDRVGYGYVPTLNSFDYSAMCVMRSYDDFEYEKKNSGVRGVAWPAENTPIEVFCSFYSPSSIAWSVTLGTYLDTSKVTVNLRNVNTGRVWNFGVNGSDGYFNVDNHGYGQVGCVIFRPDGLDSINNGDIYEVTINGIDSVSYPENSLTYNVNFFSLLCVQPSAGKDIGEPGDMYRLFNRYSGEHLYTGSIVERDNLVIKGWNYEDVAWNAPLDGGEPVYRLYNPFTGDHHYTLDIGERDYLDCIGWNYEGVAWNSGADSGTPVYRLFNPFLSIGSHHYTTSLNERNTLLANGWLDEGIAWYAAN